MLIPPRRLNDRVLNAIGEIVASDIKTLANCRVIALLNANELFGQEKANIEVFKALVQGGAELRVGVNAKESGGKVGQRIRELGLTTFDVPFGFQWSKKFLMRRPSLIINNMNHVRKASLALRREVKHFQPTHIHVTNPLTYSFVAPILRSRAFKVIYRMGDEPPHDSGPNLWIWKRCAKRADNLIANSKFVRSSILRAYPEASSKLSLIYNVASVMKTEINAATPPEPSSIPRFLFVGQIAEHKGIHHFLQAAISFAGKHSEVRFDIAGGSPYTRALEERISKCIANAGLCDRILMHGHVADLTQLYRSAVAIVVPSLFDEPAANVVLEAKRHGVPAIVYSSGGLPELVTDGVTGWVCGEKRPTEIESWMKTLSQEMPLRQAIYQDCLRETEEQFGLPRFQSAWQTIYQLPIDGRFTR